ncbi:MAG: insulinase family protein [Anaerolineae bacterium]|nr:insulinase family protein [Anaerolineae bacterium]
MTQTTIDTTSPSEIHLTLLPGPDTIARRTFANGITGLVHENPHSPSVVVHGWLWAGSIDVPRAKAGLASLTASMLTRGTDKRSFTEINQEIESVGAALSFGSSGHTTRFTIKCLVEDLDLLLDILTDCLYCPTFPSEYVDRRRGQILTAIKQREESTQAMSSLAFSELMYPDHPYGVSALGYEDTISAISREDVLSFYHDCYGPYNMGITMVGAVSADKGLDILERAFGGWQGADYRQTMLPRVEAIEVTRQTKVDIPGKAQSDILLGWLAMNRTDPDYTKAYLANCVLGEFGLMGRLGARVRQDQGLAYYAYTSLEAGLGPGPWSAIAGVDPGNVERAIDGILSEIRRLQTEPIDEQELSDNKSYLIGSLPLRIESNEGIAAQIVEMQLFDLGLDYARRVPEHIAALTAQDVMQVTQKWMDPETYVLSVAGPPSEPD